MSRGLGPRFLWLAAITLVVGIGALGLARRDAGGNDDRTLATPVPGPDGGYYTARAAPYGPTRRHRRTACNEPFTDRTQGIAHPVLPCGVKLYIRYHGREALTQVVDRGPTAAGRDFEITKALADRLDLHGTQTVKWRYVR